MHISFIKSRLKLTLKITMSIPASSKLSMEDINRAYPDVINILNRCERMVKGVCFEIIVLKSKAEEKERYVIDIDPDDVHFIHDVNDKNETFQQRLARIENLQGIYIELWAKTTEKLEQCKQKFKNTDYKILLLKRKSSKYPIKIKSCIPHDEVYKPFDTYSAASTVEIDDGKSSCSNDSCDGESSNKRKCKDEYPKISSCSEFVIIGPNGTQMARGDFELLNWEGAASSTRKLLTIIFGEKILATHNLTGNQSPAFRGRERAPKNKLDPIKISDIVYIVTIKCKVKPQVVRAAITTKCSDASTKVRRMTMKT